MRLLTPFLTDVLSTANNVLLTEEDIYEYTTEIPEQYVEATSVVYDAAQDILSATFESEEPTTYRYKSILICRNNLVLGVINEETMQEITTYRFNINIKFNVANFEPEQFNGIIDVQVYVSDSNNYYKGTSEVGLIRTFDEAKAKNKGGSVVPGYIQKNNRRFIYPLVGFNFRNYKLAYITSAVAEGRPIILIGLFTVAYKGGMHHVALDVTRKIAYSATLVDNIFDDYTLQRTDPTKGGLVTENDSTSDLDLLNNTNIEKIESGYVFLQNGEKNELIVLRNGEEAFTQYTYDELSFYFGARVDSPDVLKFLTPKYSIYFETTNRGVEGGKLMVVSRFTSDIHYYRVSIGDFLFLPYNGTYYIYAHGIYDWTVNRPWSLVDGSYDMLIDLDAQEATNDLSLLPVTIFNQKFYLRNRKLLNLV